MKFSLALSFVAAAATVATTPVLALSGSKHGESRRSHHDLAIQARGNLTKRWDCSNARATFYSTGLGACGGTNSDGDFIVALNQGTFGWDYPSKYCWKNIKISYGGKTATAQIVDSCPGCPYCGLDMSPGLFAYFADPDLGVLAVDWSYEDGSGGGSSGGGNDDGGSDHHDDGGNNDDGKDNHDDGGSKDNGNDDDHHDDHHDDDDDDKKTTSKKHHSTSTKKHHSTTTTKKHHSTTTTSSSTEATTTSTSLVASLTRTRTSTALPSNTEPAGNSNVAKSNLQSLEQVVMNLQHMIAAAETI